MSLKNEIETYNEASPTDEGEVEIFDKIIFETVIRKREINLILDTVERLKPKRILDFGCGGGWLSKILCKEGYDVVGIDASETLARNAKRINLRSEFMVCDCTELSFKENTFDMIIGVGILHHLNIHKTLVECHRILNKNGHILFMEPNSLNPLMEMGRRLLPSSIHTDDEKAMSFKTIEKQFKVVGFNSDSVKYFFPYSFCLSYFLAKIESDRMSRFSQKISSFVKHSELIFEKIPLISKMGAVIMFTGRRE